MSYWGFLHESWQYPMEGKTISLLSGHGKDITYEMKSDGKIKFHWGTTNFEVERDVIDRIKTEFFSDSSKWYELGASMKPVKEGGLGEFLMLASQYSQYKLTPRHASAIAAALVNEGVLISSGTKPIMLKKA